MKKYMLFSALVLALFISNMSLAKADYPAGCNGTSTYSTTTGQPCGATVPSGCDAGNLYSSTTGQLCAGAQDDDSSVAVAKFNTLFKSNFRVGVRGNDVKALQQFLKDEGYYFGKIDGKYGKISARAAQDFRDDNEIGSIAVETPTYIPPTIDANRNKPVIIGVGGGNTSTLTPSIISILPAGCTSHMYFSSTSGESCTNNRLSANIGDTVYIYGSNFNSDSSVVLDNGSYSPVDGGRVAVNTTFVTSTLLRFVVPTNAGRGTHSIKVDNVMYKGDVFSNIVSLNFTNPQTFPGTFSLSQSSFVFNYTQGGTMPEVQSLTFTNTSKTTISYNISVPSQPKWLNSSYNTDQLTSTPGQETGLGAWGDPTGVSPGTYNTNIFLTGNFVGSPLSIPVTLNVNPSTTSTYPSGCASDKGYSMTTGLACSNVQPQPTYPPGCLTFEGYSSVNGNACDGTTAISSNLNIITSSILQNGKMGWPYYTTIETDAQHAGGYLHTITAGALPPGLSLGGPCSRNVCTGIIGTPTVPGTYDFTITFNLSDGSGKASKKFNLVVDPSTTVAPNLVITNTSPLPNAKVGNNYQLLLGVSGGLPTVSLNSYSWTTSSGSLPAGLFFSGSDQGIIITGTPTTAGVYSFRLNTSFGSQSGSKDFALTVDPAATYPPGCSSTQGYSSVDGNACDGTTLLPPIAICIPSYANSDTPIASTNSVGSITITSPNGGECLTKGSTKTITWTNSPNIDKVTIGLVSSTGTMSWIANNIANTGSYDWSVSKWNTTNTIFKIEILGYQTGAGSVTDSSDDYFHIKN